MTMRQTTLSIPDCGAATLTLPEPLTPDSLGHLEVAINRLLCTLRRDLNPDAAEDPGSVEFDSWSANLH